MKKKEKFVKDCVGAKLKEGDYVAVMSAIDSPYNESKMRVGFVSKLIYPGYQSERIVVTLAKKDGTPKKVTIYKLDKVLKLQSCIAESIVNDRAIVKLRDEAIFIKRLIK